MLSSSFHLTTRRLLVGDCRILKSPQSGETGKVSRRLSSATLPLPEIMLRSCGQFTHSTVNRGGFEGFRDPEKSEKKQMLLVKKVIHCLAGAPSWGGRETKPESPENQLIIKKVVGIDPKSCADHVKPHASYHLGEQKHKHAVEYESRIPEAEASPSC
ncbi:hypothetical protein JB92DRAFT_1939015 [Gautieria morchelliformis]|nr:hypothetical protein JB92DRAFT_1939015 [Gautieria morchelliformis]